MSLYIFFCICKHAMMVDTIYFTLGLGIRFSILAGPLVFITFLTGLNGIKNAQPVYMS